MKNIITWFRSILFLIVFYTWSLFVCLVFLFTLFLHKKAVIHAAEVWAKGNRILLRLLVGIKVEIKGLENLPKKNGYIVASKHQSAMETVLFHAFMPNTIYVMKKSLGFLPFAGWYFWRSGCIFIDRKKGTSSLRNMYATAKERLAKGFNIIIFPEGTRTAPGAKTKYNPGLAMIYEAVNVPVIPVALNTGYFWPKNSVKRYPGTVVFEFLPQIEAGLEKREFMKILEDRIETAVAKQSS
jgi:1-acyl-sn-glycerol-3-phosphate acyltransferase